MINKTKTVLKFISILRDAINNTPEYIEEVQDIDFTYYIKIVDHIGSDISKFTIGFQDNKIKLNLSKKPDVVVTLTENAFFNILRNNMTIEQAYFGNEADIYTSDGHWLLHLIGIKKMFDKFEIIIRTKMEI